MIGYPSFKKRKIIIGLMYIHLREKLSRLIQWYDFFRVGICVPSKYFKFDQIRENLDN